MVDQFLAKLGKVEVEDLRKMATDPEADRRARAETMLADLARRLADPDHPMDLDGYEAAVSALKASPDGPRRPQPKKVTTGETFAARWEREGTHGRRKLMAMALDSVSVKAGGGRGVKLEDRVTLNWLSWFLL